MAFPLLFFISDDELLSNLGTSDPESVQEHMIKFFENTEKLKLDDYRGTKSDVGMISS